MWLEESAGSFWFYFIFIMLVIKIYGRNSKKTKNPNKMFGFFCDNSSTNTIHITN